MAKLAFHVSLRTTIYRLDGKLRVLGPEAQLTHRFEGLNFTWKLLAPAANKDSRNLYELVVEEEDLDAVPYSIQDQQDIRDAIVEGLMGFGSHLKTNTTSAKALAEKLTGHTVNLVGSGQAQTVEVVWPDSNPT
jgi:hypothetical protein